MDRWSFRIVAEAAVWHAMFAEQIPFAEKVLRTVIVYALIVVLFRFTGKRGLASMSTLDVVVIFLLSNVVQNAVISNDTSLVGAVKPSEQGATKADVAELTDRLRRIESLLTARQPVNPH